MPATSIYGTAKRKTTYKKHVWHTIPAHTRKGKLIRSYRARRIHKITAKVGKTLHNRRFTFWSKETKWIKKAKQIMEKQGLIPKEQREDGIDAEKFVKDKKYRESVTQEGEWIDFEIDETPPSHGEKG